MTYLNERIAHITKFWKKVILRNYEMLMDDKKSCNYIQKIDNILVSRSKNNGQILNIIKNANPYKKI